MEERIGVFLTLLPWPFHSSPLARMQWYTERGSEGGGVVMLFIGKMGSSECVLGCADSGGIFCFGDGPYRWALLTENVWQTESIKPGLFIGLCL